MKLSIGEIRANYFEFMKEKGHAIIPSSSLIPQNDPTTLFTGSGMQPLVPYLLGKDHPEGTRLADSQKCFRSMDIEEVGDNRHTTFFEMLGNWSLGDYFKDEQIKWFWEFLTVRLGLDPARIFVTCYIGNKDAEVPKDTESAALWRAIFQEAGIDAKEVEIGTEENGYEVGEQGGRIFFYADKNWWSRVGGPHKMPVGELGGPDTEVFYLYPDVAHDPKWGALCHPNCDCGRYIELGNSVFMQYLKTETGFAQLPKKNVDYGGGLERITAAVHNTPDVFTVAHQPIISFLESESNAKYGSSEHTTRAFRIIADHMKASVFLIADGTNPSNTDQGYFVRRLIRRAIRYSDKLGLLSGYLSKVVNPIAAMYREQYSDVALKAEAISAIIADEEDKFRRTISRGLKELDQFSHGTTISGHDAYILFTTHGFPIELTEEIAKERGVSVDRSGFDTAMEKHKEESRAGAEQKFKGGLGDQSEATTRLHTAHHLLLKALQIVLGPHVKQRGSNITGERLRIDFSHNEKMTDDQRREVERIVNEIIREELPVLATTMPKSDAEKLHAEHEFGAKYPESVTVYSIGPKTATPENPQFGSAFSIEFCGGPHVENTSDLIRAGQFKIQKEEASSAGVRRIKAVFG